MKLIYSKIKFKILLLLLFYIFWPAFEGNAQNPSENKIKIIEGIFENCKLNTFKNKYVITTIARNKFASIPLNNSECKIINLENGLSALAFNIYLSDIENDYESMIRADLYNFMDLNEGDSLERLQKNERLIQVILFNMEKNNFIAKANTFPIEKLKWLPTGMGDFTQYESLSNLAPIKNATNSFYLEISECPDCSQIYYFFKYVNHQLKCSEKISGCFENLRENDSQILADKITNCYEVNYDGAEPVIKTIKVLEW